MLAKAWVCWKGYRWKLGNSWTLLLTSPNAMHPYEARVGKGRQILTSDSSITSWSWFFQTAMPLPSTAGLQMQRCCTYKTPDFGCESGFGTLVPIKGTKFNFVRKTFDKKIWEQVVNGYWTDSPGMCSDEVDWILWGFPSEVHLNLALNYIWFSLICWSPNSAPSLWPIFSTPAPKRRDEMNSRQAKIPPRYVINALGSTDALRGKQDAQLHVELRPVEL